MSVLNISDVCQRCFHLISFLWIPSPLLAKLNLAICGLGKYFLIFQIFPSTYLLGCLLFYLGLAFSCVGKLIIALVYQYSEGPVFLLPRSPVREMQLCTSGSSLELQCSQAVYQSIANKWLQRLIASLSSASELSISSCSQLMRPAPSSPMHSLSASVLPSIHCFPR